MFLRIEGTRLTDDVLAFEKKYTTETNLLAHIRYISSVSNELLVLLSKIQPDGIQVFNRVPERLIERMRVHLDALQENGHLSYSYIVMGLELGGTNSGNSGNLTVQVDSAFSQATASFLRP